MDWQQMKEYLDQCYDFFGRMDASESATQEPVPIHPLLRLSAILDLNQAIFTAFLYSKGTVSSLFKRF